MKNCNEDMSNPIEKTDSETTIENTLNLGRVMRKKKLLPKEKIYSKALALVTEIPDADCVARTSEASLRKKLIAVLPKMTLASIHEKLTNAMHDGWQHACCEMITAEELKDYEVKTRGNDLGYDLTRYLTTFGYRVKTKRDSNHNLRIDISWEHHLHLDNI